MKQPEDTKTIDLLAGEKRGRGRPRVENALSPAERAKRYRQNQRRRLNNAEVTENTSVTKNSNKCDVTESRALFDSSLESRIVLLNVENIRLAEDLEASQRRAADLRDLVQIFIDARIKKKSIPADVFRNICKSLLKL